MNALIKEFKKKYCRRCVHYVECSIKNDKLNKYYSALPTESTKNCVTVVAFDRWNVPGYVMCCDFERAENDLKETN